MIPQNREQLQIINLQEKFRQNTKEESLRSVFFDNKREFIDAATRYKLQLAPDGEKALDFVERARARSLLELRASQAALSKINNELLLQASIEFAPLTINQIRQRIQRHAAVIEFAVLPEKIVSWVISRDSIHVFEIPAPENDLRVKISQFVELISTAQREDSRQVLDLAKELYAVLILPLIPHLYDVRVLCIIPDQALHYLPFSALLSHQSGKYLIEDYEIITAPSAATFILCSESIKNKQPRIKRMLSVGSSGLLTSLPDLSSDLIETEAVAGLYRNGDWASQSLVGEQATEEAFKKIAPTAGVIHIASHAIADQRSSLLSKLIFTKAKNSILSEDTDGLLHAYELHQMRLPQASLVVLSACKTGIGRIFSGEGSLNLARPFLSTGVPTVIASLWDIDSSYTRNIMLRFHYHYLRQSYSATRALRSAQLEAIHSTTTPSNPLLAWAAYSVIGGANL